MGWGTGNIGGGGASLNFKVVGNPQPENPKENTIWIDTDTKITSYIFSATEPEAPAEGMVWISTGTSSPMEFNALKKNAIQVYPMSAKQMVGGALVDVPAMSYHGGEWVEWLLNVYLFDNGDQCRDITGGWVAENYHSGYMASGGNVEFADDCMVIHAIANGSMSAITANKIDLTSYSKLRVQAKTAQGAYGVVINSEFPVSDFMSTRDVTISKTEKEDTYVDLSTLNGEHRIAITSISQGIPLYIYEVELQK